MKVFLKILMWVAIIALVIFITLFVAMKVGQFASMKDLIDYLINGLKGMFS